MDSYELEVLIYVVTYNHGKYIEECLKSIFMQKCNFDYKVAVCDDFSTDNNRSIIDKYKSIYGERLICLYMNENTYSKNEYNIHRKNIANLPKAKYIALIEGDDYFLVDDKLQRQYEFMEKNEECSICFHATELYDALKEKKMFQIPSIRFIGNKDRVIDSEYIVINTLKSGNIFSLNSFFIRENCLNKIEENDKVWNSPMGDFIWTILLCMYGKVGYLNRIMSVKRVNNIGSLSYENNISDYREEKQKIEKLQSEIEEIKILGQKIGTEYDVFIDNCILKRKIMQSYISKGKANDIRYIIWSNGKKIKNRYWAKIISLYYRIKELLLNDEYKNAIQTNNLLKKELCKLK